MLPSFIMGLSDIIHWGSTLISIVFILVFFITKKCIFKTSALLIFAMYATFIASTITNNGNIFSSLIHSSEVILVCILIDSISDDYKTLEPFLYAIRDVSLLFYVINIFLLLIMPNGIPSMTLNNRVPQFLYGNVNTVIRRITPGICCSMIISYNNNKKFSIPTLIFMGGIIYSAIAIYFTATAIVSIAVIVLWISFNKFTKESSYRKYSIAIIFIIIFEFFIVLTSNAKWLMTFITTFFNKTITFSGRTFLWSRTYELILQKPILGYGLKDSEELILLIGNGSGSHNYYLDLLFRSGLIGLLSVIILIVTPIILGWNKKHETKNIYIIIGVCFSIIIMSLTEPIYTTEVLLIPILYSLFSHFCQKSIVIRKKHHI